MHPNGFEVTRVRIGTYNFERQRRTITSDTTSSTGYQIQGTLLDITYPAITRVHPLRRDPQTFAKLGGVDDVLPRYVVVTRIDRLRSDLLPIGDKVHAPLPLHHEPMRPSPLHRPRTREEIPRHRKDVSGVRRCLFRLCIIYQPVIDPYRANVYG